MKQIIIIVIIVTLNQGLANTIFYPGSKKEHALPANATEQCMSYLSGLHPVFHTNKEVAPCHRVRAGLIPNVANELVRFIG